MIVRRPWPSAATASSGPQTRDRTPRSTCAPQRSTATVAATIAFVALGAVTGLGGCSKTKDKAADHGKAHVFGKDEVSPETEAHAKETIDPNALDSSAELRQRVLTMNFEEVVARAGFLEYHGVAKFDLTVGGRDLALTEDTTIQHGLNGSFRVLQLDDDGDVTRETIYDNGIFFVRNGGGDMRVQGIVKDQHFVVRDEAWQPLRVYTNYFGPRLGLMKVGADPVDGRSAVHYRYELVPGPEMVSAPGMDGPKKPVSLSGDLWVDEATSIPVKTSLRGVLEVPNTKGELQGKLTLALDFTVKSTEGVEIRPKSFVPTIKRHPVDNAPLGFLDGGVRTSTVIGGKRPKNLTPPPGLEESPQALSSTTTPKGKESKDTPATTEPGEKPRKKKSKKH